MISPTWYEVCHEGKWTTIRTCRGPIGAYRTVLGTWADNIKINSYERISLREWNVNGSFVRELLYASQRAG